MAVPKHLEYHRSEKVRRAARAYRTFVARPANVVVPVHLPLEGKSWERLCSFRTIVYRSDKWGKKGSAPVRYYHPFADRVQRSVYRVGDYIVGAGLVRVTRHGIEDTTTWSRLTGKSDPSARAVLGEKEKVWACIATLEAFDLPCVCGNGCLTYVPPVDEKGTAKPGTDAWTCPSCRGSTPRYRHGPGKVYVDPRTSFLVAAARVRKEYRPPRKRGRGLP